MPTIKIHDYYPHPMKKRYGGTHAVHMGIKHVLDRHKDDYSHFLKETAQYMDTFMTLPVSQENPSQTPCWNNGFFPFLDIISLYGLIAHEKPKRYIEIGSGHSTKVARLAKNTLSLDVRITSIDPTPRAEIDELCDDVIRIPLQDCDLSIFDDLTEGDILFFDGSHRVLQNSDNQVLFFELIPRIKPNVLIHIHDIFWPHDYPDVWTDRYYNEQYVLGAMLLYAPEMFHVLFPASYISRYVNYQKLFAPLWERPGFESMEKRGCSFWFKKRHSNHLENA